MATPQLADEFYAELRREAEDGTAHLEEIFLKLTGGADVQELVASLRPNTESGA